MNAKYAIAQYDPSKAVDAELYDKLDVLNDFTQGFIADKVRAYCKKHPKENVNYTTYY